jgi:hypothetical protein
VTTRRAPPQLVPMTTALALSSLGLPIGFLTGLIGIGGVLLTPVLEHLFGRDIHESVSRLDFSRRDHPCGFGWGAPGACDPEGVSVSDRFGLRCLCWVFLIAQTVVATGTLGWLGVVTGLLSVINGTGGPLICLPLLLWMGIDVRHALLLAQAAQLPSPGLQHS